MKPLLLVVEFGQRHECAVSRADQFREQKKSGLEEAGRNGCTVAGSFLTQLCYERADGPQHAGCEINRGRVIAGQFVALARGVLLVTAQGLYCVVDSSALRLGPGRAITRRLEYHK